VDLDRYETVDVSCGTRFCRRVEGIRGRVARGRRAANAFVIDGAERIARIGDVAHSEREENLLRIRRLTERRSKLLVVTFSGGNRMLEDRRIRRHAHDTVAHQARELPPVEHLARQVIYPDALA